MRQLEHFMIKKHKKNSTALKVHVFNSPSGYIEAVSVERTADAFGVSERRVRQMLTTGVIHGEKVGRAWRVTYPYRVVLGTRGPASSAFKKDSRVPKKRWKSSRFTNSKTKKGDGNSFDG
jgi:hypothetical protein